jgi:hypothetical protein
MRVMDALLRMWCESVEKNIGGHDSTAAILGASAHKLRLNDMTLHRKGILVLVLGLTLNASTRLRVVF